MVSMVKVWNTNENYWVLNPMMLTIKAFKDLYDSDKSKGKADSSKLMWAIVLLIDPNEANPWRTTSYSDRGKLIKEDYLRMPKFNWDIPEIVSLIDVYKDKCLTIAEKELLKYEKKLTQRGDFIDKTDYSLDYYEEDEKGKVKLKRGTADQLDKMMLNTSKIYEELSEIKANLLKEATEGTLRGGAEESASEKGEL